MRKFVYPKTLWVIIAIIILIGNGCGGIDERDLQKQIQKKFNSFIRNNLTIEYVFKGIGEGDADTFYYLFNVNLSASKDTTLEIPNIGTIFLSKGESITIKLYGVFNYDSSTKKWQLKKIFKHPN